MDARPVSDPLLSLDGSCDDKKTKKEGGTIDLAPAG
jgi:hypothetical protein